MDEWTEKLQKLLYFQRLKLSLLSQFILHKFTLEASSRVWDIMEIMSAIKQQQLKG